jgi:hypothetical protein
VLTLVEKPVRLTIAKQQALLEESFGTFIATFACSGTTVVILE